MRWDHKCLSSGPKQLKESRVYSSYNMHHGPEEMCARNVYTALAILPLHLPECPAAKLRASSATMLMLAIWLRRGAAIWVGNSSVLKTLVVRFTLSQSPP